MDGLLIINLELDNVNRTEIRFLII